MILKKFNFILFGATGDLAMRKLIPSLFAAFSDGLTHKEGKIVALGRQEISREEFLTLLNQKSKIHIKNVKEQIWAEFLQNIDYTSINILKPDDFKKIAPMLAKDAQSVIYLSVAPEFFAKACANLAKVGLNGKDFRIVLEKPLGTDLASCQKIHEEIGKHFSEEQIYRIDHYLGKQSVMNILNLRLENPIFEFLWNKEFIQSIEITIAETLGVEGRGEFYDATGALRDMLQNHILQILCMVAMEIPQSLQGEEMRTKKLEILANLKPIEIERIGETIILGQYTNTDGVAAYLDEPNVPSDSRTETFVAMRAQINLPRWEGVPFYLRTGKRLASKVARVVVNFKNIEKNASGANQLVINLQPKNDICLSAYTRNKNRIEEKALLLDLADKYGSIDAYECLLLDAIDGNPAKFNHRNELEVAWTWLTPVIESMRAYKVPVYTYLPGSWGPNHTKKLVRRDGNSWNND